MSEGVEQGAQRLLDWERTRPHGRMLGAALDEVHPLVRAAMVQDATLAYAAQDTRDAARAMAHAHGIDWAIVHARPYWEMRVGVARGMVRVNPPPPYDEAEAQREREKNMRPRDPNACAKCGAPMRWATHWRTKNPMPLDPDPVPGFEDKGNVLLDGNGIAYVFPNYDEALGARGRDIAAGGQRGITGQPMTAHHYTCAVVRAEREAVAEVKRQAEIRRVGGEQAGLFDA